MFRHAFSPACIQFAVVLSITVGLCAAPGNAATIIKMYDVFEVSFTSDVRFDNPFWDAAVSAEFVSPAGKKVMVEVFYYGGYDWRARCAPSA